MINTSKCIPSGPKSHGNINTSSHWPPFCYLTLWGLKWTVLLEDRTWCNYGVTMMNFGFHKKMTFLNSSIPHNSIQTANQPSNQVAHFVAVFWIVTPSSDVLQYRRFGGLCYLHLHFTLRIETVWSSETLISYHNITWRHKPYDHDLNLHRHENLKYHVSNSAAVMTRKWDWLTYTGAAEKRAIIKQFKHYIYNNYKNNNHNYKTIIQSLYLPKYSVWIIFIIACCPAAPV
jgi:hypothetical protein